MHPDDPDGATETFLARVQHHADVSTRTEAERFTQATLDALAEAVSSGQMVELTRGLPVNLRPDPHHGSGQARAFDRGSFLDKVSGSVSAVDPETVEHQVRAVLRTVREWAPEGQSADTRAQLPPELARLFE